MSFPFSLSLSRHRHRHTNACAYTYIHPSSLRPTPPTFSLFFSVFFPLLTPVLYCKSSYRNWFWRTSIFRKNCNARWPWTWYQIKVNRLIVLKNVFSFALVLPCFSFFWRNPIMLWVCCEFIFQFFLLSWYFPWSDVRLNTFQTFTIFDKIFVLTVEMYWHWQRTIRDFHWSLHCTACIIVKNLNVSILRLWIFILYNTHTETCGDFV